MIFPRSRAVLENAKLSFVNFDNVLVASKKERASKISGYISLTYPDTVELIFLRLGEPVNAARFSKKGRAIIPINEAINKAKSSHFGIAGIYEVPGEVISMILSTIKSKPVYKDISTASSKPEDILASLKKVKFTGFVEARKGVEVSYISFKEGEAAKAYSPRGVMDFSTDKFLKLLSMEKNLLLDAYEEAPEKLEQATPALIMLFLKMLNGMTREFSSETAKPLVAKFLKASKEEAEKKCSIIKDFTISDDMKVSGETLTSPDELSKSFAEWISIFIESFRSILGDRTDDIIANAIKDYRFAIKTTGFFKHAGLKKFLS